MFADLRLLLAAPMIAAIIVALAPARMSRGLAGLFAGLTLIVAVAVVLADPATLGFTTPWVPALGINFKIAVGGLTAPGLLVTCLIGQIAALAPGGSRGSIAGGLALQGVVLATLLAGDLGLMVACYGLLAPLAGVLVTSGARPGDLRAGLAVAAYLSLGTALLALAAGALAVGYHDASGGVWSLELADLATVLLPGRAEAAVGLALALVGVLTLGLWPLHGWLISGLAAARPGPALLLAGAVRWLGVDLLLRLWLTLTPAAAAAQAPTLAWIAVLGAAYGAVVARAEPDPRRALGLAALAPAGLLVLGLAGQHHEGIIGATMLALALCLGAPAGLLADAETHAHAGPRARLLRRTVPLGLLPAPGLVGLVGVALVAIGSARFAGLTLGAHAMWLACAAVLVALLSVASLTRRTWPEGPAASDMSDVPAGGPLRVAALLLPVIAAGVWPGRALWPVEAPGRALLAAAARLRCERATLEIAGPTQLGGEPGAACVQPLRALELLHGGER